MTRELDLATIGFLKPFHARAPQVWHRSFTWFCFDSSFFPSFFSKADVPILCEDCNGRGWLLCDFCKGQKMNVKSETNRIYGRCPSCRTGKRRKRENKILYLSGTLYIFHAFLQLESFGRAC
ncbi:uncharacterized protein LOC126631842 isoform X6 [Malus sylvestris]|uniref:uncharacterized protein LOC126631842 isoform X6 n=1 Tax=Malus sylvestris TaxID=3752 RepID=UPI0021ACF936|nr:uncharacterized protein LOC126631842 isoform X6 [Malus sylvestris]